MPIRVLDALTISKIAAGEVVERPSSVLKELVENALDAGARHITVEIRAGGIDYLRVTDDGCGIPSEQVRMAFENHATSKLREVKDLVDVSTMGFRGEALPSIAAVSRVEMTTRARGADTGTCISLEAGSVLDVKPAGCPDGTTVQVRDLFFNLPARRAFLKKPASEAGACIDIMSRLALGNPGIAFRMTSNGKLAFRTQGDGIIRHAIMAVYDRTTAENMVEVNGAVGSLTIAGLIGVGSCAKASRAHQHFFVNGRAIRCSMLSQALEQACRGRVLIGRFPMCALSIGLPPGSVDVNVHPSKLEVRFRDEAGLFTAASILMEQAFTGENMLTPEQPPEEETKPAIFIEQTTPNSDVQQPEAVDKNQSEAQLSAPASVDNVEEKLLDKQSEMKLGVVRIPFATNPIEGIAAQKADAAENMPDMPQKAGTFERSSALRMREGMDAFRPAAEAIRSAAVEKNKQSAREYTLMDAAGLETPDEERKPEWKIVGVTFSTYIFVESGDTLYAIDQHAAHERVLYEKYMKEWESGIQSQILLTPYTLTVSAAEKAQIMENRELLYEVGFDVDDFGDRDIQVRAVPQIMGEPDLRPFFLMGASELKRLRSAPLQAKRDAIMQAACKHAIKGGDPLSRADIESLLDQMRATGAPANCPHGRPVIIAIPKSELEKRFSRIV